MTASVCVCAHRICEYMHVCVCALCVYNRVESGKPPTNNTNVYYLPISSMLASLEQPHPRNDVMEVQSWFPWGNETGANGTFALVSTMVCWLHASDENGVL